MPYASNALDACRVYFEDDGGDGMPVVFLGDSSIRLVWCEARRSPKRCMSFPRSSGSSTSITGVTDEATSRTTPKRMRCVFGWPMP